MPGRVTGRHQGRHGEDCDQATGLLDAAKGFNRFIPGALDRKLPCSQAT
ncbi:MAG: hypothetical protein MZV63_11550 [Marinilabiliales bacterium]|nr:hypothetical protein [Marinilabiliales bacterium]